MVIFDEAQNQYGEEAVVYLLSRLRSKSKAHHQLVMTANPRDCWLKAWVEWCLDEDGVPKAGTENIIRWFVRIDNKMHWADTKEELLKQFPDSLPLSFRFIPATCEDNPVLLKNNPGYLANLRSLKKVDQLRLWKGSWTATQEGGTYWKSEWVPKVSLKDVPEDLDIVRAYDMGGGAPSAGLPNPDWTVGVKMGKSRSTGLYYILDVVRWRKSVFESVSEIIKVAYDDGPHVKLIIPKDSAAGGAYANAFTVRTLAEAGVACKSEIQSGHSGKLQKFLPFCSLSEAGGVRMVIADWNEAFENELNQFSGGTRNQKDD